MLGGCREGEVPAMVGPSQISHEGYEENRWFVCYRKNEEGKMFWV